MEMEHLILKSLKMSSQTCFILNSRFVLTKESACLIGLILVPRATRLFLNYVSCSSGNGQKFIFVDWPNQTVCAIT